jgi:hypothetical protein
MLALPVRRTALTLAAVGFVVSAIAFLPGSAAADFSWFGVRPAGIGVAALFAAHLLLFWCGLFLVGKAMIDAGASWGALTPLIGVFPLLFDFFRVVSDESALACAWMFALGLAFDRAVAGRHVGFSAAGALLALAYGGLLRLASIPAAIPPLFLFAGAFAPRPVWLRWLAVGLIPVLLIGGALALDRGAFDGDRHRALIAFDLGDMSARIDENLLPGTWTRADETQILQCEGEDWRGDGRCAFVALALPEKGLWGAWAGEIIAHPGAYLRHRLDHANRLLRWLGEAPQIVTDSAENVSSLKADGNLVLAAMAPIANALGATPLFRGYAWLLAAGAVLWLGLVAADTPPRRLAVAAGASALIYFAIQILCGIDDQFQRLFWPVAASLAGGVALLACRWPPHSRLGALVLIGCVAVAAFAASALIV